MAKDEGVKVSDSLGVQTGSGNTQHNYYRALDASFLTTLSAHKAVARLRGMPHDDAVSALASVPPSDVIDVLKADEALTVALLADLNPRKAKELIGLLQTDWPWLASLPGAAEALARRAAELKWDPDGSTGPLEHVSDTSTEDVKGYAQRYPKGWICFNGLQACAITGAIAEIYANSGGPGGPLGLPLSEEIPVEPKFGTQNTVQYFKDALVCVSPRGAYIVSGKIGEKISDVTDACLEWLGFPVAEREDRDGYSLQRFEGGAIFSSETGTFTVRQAILEMFERDEIPVSDEAEATSPYSTTGWAQESQGYGDDDDVLNCSSKAHGTYYIHGAALERYRALGGTASWLGFPVSQADIASPEPESWVQQFEGGVIVEVDGQTTAFAVPADTSILISDAHNGDKFGCGWPVSEELPIGTDSGDRIQFFAGAVVTLREGKRELWPRPAGRR